MPLPDAPAPLAGFMLPPRYDAAAMGAALNEIARQVRGAAREQGQPVFHAVMLLAPDGSTWRVSVDAAGALATVLVSRT